MITPEEYIEKKPGVIWFHALDALEHGLQGDIKQTAYKNIYPDKGCLNSLRIELEKHKEPNGFDEIVEDAYRPEYKVKAFDSENGDLQVDRYLNNDKLCFDEFEKEIIAKPCISIMMDIAIPANERDGSEMQQRHERIYAIAAAAEAEKKPCRVIACAGVIINELQKPLKIYLIIKDFNDPIFPGIWGAFKNNASTNDFLNVIMDFIVGTRSAGNGTPTMINISDDIDPEEVIVLDSRRILINGRLPK